MPKTRRYRKKRWSKKSKGLNTLEKRQVKNMILHKIEKKSKTQTLISFPSITNSVPANFSINDLLIAKGDESNERDGDQITPLKYQVMFQLDANQATAPTSPLMRVICFQVRDVFPSNMVSHPITLYPRQADADAQYKILYDRQFRIGNVEGSNQYQVAKITIPLKKLMIKKLTFDGGALNTIQKGNIYVRIVSANTASNAHRIYYTQRLYYTD